MISPAWRKLVKEWLKKAGLDQRRCANCRAPFSPGEDNSSSPCFCEDCVAAVTPYVGARCRLCGSPLGPETRLATRASPTPVRVCSDCARTPPPWQGAAFPGLYGGPLRDIVLRLKFDGELSLARPLALIMLESAVCLPKPDFLVPVPLYPKKLFHRGYNQAAELAKAVASESGFGLKLAALKRVLTGPPQESLSAAERRQNLRNAFACSEKFTGETAWLIDDVMTTGSTVREGARALLAAGCSRVYALFVARTPVE